MSENPGKWPTTHESLDAIAAAHNVEFDEDAKTADKVSALEAAGLKPPSGYGLVLTLGGAPATPHTVPGLDGTFRPDVPTPLEEAGITLEQAQALDADEGCPLELVKIRR